jgi:hypothetical protein
MATWSTIKEANGYAVHNNDPDENFIQNFHSLGWDHCNITLCIRWDLLWLPELNLHDSFLIPAEQYTQLVNEIGDNVFDPSAWHLSLAKIRPKTKIVKRLRSLRNTLRVIRQDNRVIDALRTTLANISSIGHYKTRNSKYVYINFDDDVNQRFENLKNVIINVWQEISPRDKWNIDFPPHSTIAYMNNKSKFEVSYNNTIQIPNDIIENFITSDFLTIQIEGFMHHENSSQWESYRSL